MTEMYERAYGYLYNAKADVKEDAASIRRIVKTLVKGGLLPADWKYTVRIGRGSMSTSIDVRGIAPRTIFAANPDTYDHPWVTHAETGEQVHAYVDRFTIEAAAVLATLEELHNAHNHDGSDTQSDYFDVKFYGRAQVEGTRIDGRWDHAYLTAEDAK